jgi:hypothetical protein
VSGLLSAPTYTTSEGENECEKDRDSPLAEEDMPATQTEEDEDTKPLSAKMARLRKEAAREKAMGTPTLVRARRKAIAGRSVMRPADLSSGSDTDLGNESDSTRGGYFFTEDRKRTEPNRNVGYFGFSVRLRFSLL